MKQKLLNNKLTLKNDDNLMLVFILILVTILVSIIKPSFLSLGTLESMAYQLPEIGLLTLAMMVTMIAGGINLSVIASANLSGIIMALIMTNFIPKGAENTIIVILAMIAGITISIVIGFFNGVIISTFKIPAILVTLGTQMLVNGICLVITKGSIISGFPRFFKNIGNGKLLGIPTPIILFIIGLIVLAIILRRTSLGAGIYLYGSNNIATIFSGVNDKALIIKTYTLSGFFVGLAAIILTSRFNSAATGYAETFLMQAILAAVLGGTNPNGGGGKISGIILSLIIIQVVASGLNILKVSSYLTTALYGIILLVAVYKRSKRIIR
jgi:simple sugar transport system permease protein